MVDNALHGLFHELVGAINGISLMSQMCVQFIEMIKLENSNSKLKEEAASNFKNIGLYYDRAAKDLETTVGALAKIKSSDIGVVLRTSIGGELEKVKNLINNSKDFYAEILMADGIKDFSRFTQEFGKIELLCNFMVETINISKKKLIEQGKY